MPVTLTEARDMLSLAVTNERMSNEVERSPAERRKFLTAAIRYALAANELVGEFLKQNVEPFLACVGLFMCAGAAWFWTVAFS